MALVTVHPGGLRELHWHPNADEWQYFISGKGRMTVVDTGNKARTMDFQEGDVGYVQKTLLHYVENTGDTDLVFLEMFGKVDRFQDFRFRNGWLILHRKRSWHTCTSIRRPSMRFPRTAAWSCLCPKRDLCAPIIGVFRLFVLGVADSQTAGIGHGAFAYRQSDPRCNTKRDAVDNSKMIDLCAQTIVG